MAEKKPLNLSENIVNAIEMWRKHGFKPGSCTEFLLRGDYNRAFQHAHPLLKPRFKDHIKYVESLPEDFRGKNFDTWKGIE